MSDQEKSQSQNESNQLELEVGPLRQKHQKILNLNRQARMQVENISKNIIRKAQLNGQIDPNNQARPNLLKVTKQNTIFDHFMTKKKHQDKKKQAFSVMRQMLQAKGYDNISHVSQKEQNAIMVVRFVKKIQTQPNMMEIEDQFCKEREKIQIKLGIVWVGLICAIEATYENQIYKFKRVIDLCQEDQSAKIPATLSTPYTAYRMMLVKGSFWKNDGKDNLGIQLIVKQLEHLKYKQNVRVNALVIMGPILSIHNQHVKKFTLEDTYQEVTEEILQKLKNRAVQIVPQIQIIVVPSIDDVASIHPIPQPEFNFQPQENLKYASNPTSLKVGSGKSGIQIDLINYDLVTYFDENKVGKPKVQVIQDNLQTYFKQPFYLTNTEKECPFDQTNLNNLFNRGQFGNIVVISSKRHGPFVRKIKGKLFVNIGSLGVDKHELEKHFMVLISVYEGQGNIQQRVKIQSVTM